MSEETKSPIILYNPADFGVKKLQGNLPEYRIWKEIGEGGTGIVYIARHLPTQTTRAIKWNIDKDGLKLGRVQESEISAQVETPYERKALFTHPNIITIHEYGKIEEIPYSVMDYLPGANLEEIITEEPHTITIRQLKKIFSQVIEAIGHLHRHGHIYRDIKLDNILIHNGKATLIDVDLIVQSPHLGTIFCNPHYFTRDHVLGSIIDERTDVCSLALTAYAALSNGNTPVGQELNKRGEHELSLHEIWDYISNTQDIQTGKGCVIAAPKTWNKVFEKTIQETPENRLSLDEFKKMLMNAFDTEIKERQRKMFKWTIPT